MMPQSYLYTTLSQEVGLLQHTSPTGMNKCSKRFANILFFHFYVLKVGGKEECFHRLWKKRRFLKCEEKTVGNRSREEESLKRKQKTKGNM